MLHVLCYMFHEESYPQGGLLTGNVVVIQYHYKY